MARRRGNDDDDELFTSDDDGDSPTVKPLRISKSPPPQKNAPSGRHNGYPTPKHSFPLPLLPGASSSAQPLPYPEDNEPYQYTPPSNSRANNKISYPEDRRGTPERTEQNSSMNLRFGGSPIDKRGPRLAERRGAIPKPLPESPGPEVPDKEEDDDDDDLFVRQPVRHRRDSDTRPAAEIHPVYDNRAWVPPAIPESTSNHKDLAAPVPTGMNRFASSASVSTTRATRGSPPPPPETPIVGPGEADGGIEARYAAAGIAGAATLSSLQAQNAAAAQRQHQYGPPPVPQLPQSPGLPTPQHVPRRPWTPTESPDNQPHGPPTVYQGANQLSDLQPLQSPRQDSQERLERDFQRMQMSASPPPAYSSVTVGHPANGTGSNGHPDEKRRTEVTVKPNIQVASPLASPALQHPGHPAFANDPRPVVSNIQPEHLNQNTPVQQFANPSQFQNQPLASPPPLPEGWMANLDQTSGQYYYIHRATQATQWEFPTGPTPKNHDMTPLSPVNSTYGNPLGSPSLSTYGNQLGSPGLSAFGKQPMGSPAFPHTPGYAESIMSMASQTPTSGFFGPPQEGADLYKVAPTNGVYFGPYLRYTNMDLERGIWLGTIMLVTDGPQPPTIHIHQSMDLSPNPRQLRANPVYTHRRWVFYRYDVDLQMDEHGSSRWTYAITSHLGCTRYEFLVAGRHETNWRLIAHSGNDFGVNTSSKDRARLGGVGIMWKDILQKNDECGGFHVQLGLGNQIYGDRLWKEIPLLKQWLAMSGKDNRKNASWTARHQEDVSHAYFHYYTSHFDQPSLREAFARIPHILQIDDHDVFDGFGSYPEYMQSSNVVKSIGRIAIEMYLLFQHHTTLEILRNVSTDTDLFTVTGTGWHFVKYLGPAVVVAGPDCRSERTQQQVMAGPTYQGIFPKIAVLPPSVQHCIWMVSTPLVYPRLEGVESIAHTVASGKKAVTGTYNLLGKVTSSVAGVVGGKEVVQSGFSQVKKAVGKSGLMGNVLTPFGDLDIADEFRDMWTHESKDLERTYFIRTLQGISQQKGIRMTFLSGGVNCCGAGLVHDPSRPSDHKTMYQLITSSVVAAPMSGYVAKLLHNQKILYVPANGTRSTHAITDTKEDMMEIFQSEANGTIRDMKKLMARRNYIAIVAYDPEAIQGTQYAINSSNGSTGSGQGLGGPKLSLAVDFVVQADNNVTMPTKYGPVIVPGLEFGR